MLLSVRKPNVKQALLQFVDAVEPQLANSLLDNVKDLLVGRIKV